MRVVQHQRGRVPQGRVALDLRLGRALHRVAFQLAPGVERLEIRHDDARAREILAQPLGRARAVLAERQQFDAGGRVRQPAGRVQPRADDEADVFLREVRRVELRSLHQRLQAEPLRMAQRGQPALQEIARVPAQHREIRHDAERDQIQQPRHSVGAPRPVI